MHRSVHLLQPEWFDLPEVLEMLSGGGDMLDDVDKLLDFDTECWHGLCFSTIDDHPACITQEDILGFNHPVTGKVDDPLLSSYWEECEIRYEYKDDEEFQHLNNKEVDKVTSKSKRPSETVSHLEDHSYYQNEPPNEPAGDGDSSNSVACYSNSSSESEEIDVEYVEPPIQQPKRQYLRRNTRQQNSRNKKAVMAQKQASRIDKSYHNELERKRRQEQRECLDYLRHRLGLPEKSSKKLILNTAREQIISLEKESDENYDIYEEEMERNRLLTIRLSQLMGRY